MSAYNTVEKYDPQAKLTVDEHFKKGVDISFVTITDVDGNHTVFFPDDGRDRIEVGEPKFPYPATQIRNVANLITVTYTGSQCQLIIKNGEYVWKCRN